MLRLLDWLEESEAKGDWYADTAAARAQVRQSEAHG